MSEKSVKEELYKWLLDFISLFRDELNKLPQEIIKASSYSLFDLSEPCQILVIWARDPEFQIIIHSRIEELEDKSIEIYGPIENFKLIEHIESEILKSRLINILGKEYVEDFLVHALRDVQKYYNPLGKPPKTGIRGQTHIGLTSSYPYYAIGHVIIGNIKHLDARQLVNKIIQDIKSSIKRKSGSSPLRKEKLILDGFGSYIYPQVWIGEPPKPRSFREKLSGLPLLHAIGKRVISDKYKKRPLIITKNGYIAIGEKDKQKAQELLNEIMSVLLLRGIPVFIIREVDLGEAKFTEKSAQWSGGKRGLLYFYDLSSYVYPAILTGRMKSISKENLEKVIRLSELLTSDNVIKTLLLLYLEAYTHFQNSEYKQCLILSWVILEEFYIKDLWSDFIRKNTSDKNRISKLGSWNIDQRLETLNLSHMLTNQEYNLLMKIKSVRNEIVHEGKTPPRNVVEESLELVIRIIQGYTGKYIGSKFGEL